MIAALGDASQFANGWQISAWLGLTLKPVEWMPSTSYRSIHDAKRNVSYFLMNYYNW
ncbi:hypothetical protein OLMES_5264 [Oleiphilus messinensis]|uniref:Uncharacterized protein n=1 Tax=Oleiphilus messinensis TaxID=141451 RepID=A0A1Y0IFE6_9GAMM|nr:hypothetical protein OLMES_5264 [Oleiphilus messinensis]